MLGKIISQTLMRIKYTIELLAIKKPLPHFFINLLTKTGNKLAETALINRSIYLVEPEKPIKQSKENLVFYEFNIEFIKNRNSL